MSSCSARRRGDRRARRARPGRDADRGRPDPDGRRRAARARGWPRPPGLDVQRRPDRRRRARCARAPRACYAAGDVALAHNAAAGRHLAVEHWGEALNMGEIAGRAIAGERRAVGRRPRLLVDDRRAHAQVRRVGRRLRRGAPRRPRQRRVDGLVRHARARPSACSPTSATRTTSTAASGSRPERRCRERAAQACVIVPARDEEELIGACIAALAAQTGVARDEYEVLLVLDRCTDATEARARAAAGATDAARARSSTEPGVGHARRQGMDLAAERLPPRRPDRHHRRRLRARAGLAARPARRGRRRARGRSAAGSRSARTTSRPRPSAPRGRRRHAATRALARRRRARAPPVQRRVARASPPRPTRRSAGWSRATRSRMRASSARCTATACRSSGSPRCASRPPARRIGRARRGLAVDLRRNSWLAERSYDARRLHARAACSSAKAADDQRHPPDARGRGHARPASSTRSRRCTTLIDELLVVDGDSRDGTADVARERGVRVESESALQPEHGPALGKGDAMWRGLAATTGELVVLPRHRHRGLRRGVRRSACSARC